LKKFIIPLLMDQLPHMVLATPATLDWPDYKSPMAEAYHYDEGYLKNAVPPFRLDRMDGSDRID
jgi:hypothetical protein